MQEAEIDNTSDRIKKRRRSTEPGTDNISALVPRQVLYIWLFHVCGMEGDGTHG